MRIPALLCCAVALCAEAPPPELQRFDEALLASRFKEASAIVDKLIEERTPKDGVPHADSLLNSLLGRLLLAGHESNAAANYLEYAQTTDLPVAVRARTALAYGHALELQGDRSRALQAYRDAVATATDAERREAELGIARQLLVEDPSAVRRHLQTIAGGAPAADRWQARYLLSLASSLTDDAASAARFADEAWADAANAPPAALAPLHVATLKAGLAAARGDRTAERAMLAASNGLNVKAADSLAAQLPVCGDDGIRPTDFVTFGIVVGPYATRDLVPIVASRTAIVAPFHSRLAGFDLVKEVSGNPPLGSVVTVSCRSSVSKDFIANPMSKDPLLDWFVQRGLYPARATSGSEDTNINAIAARIDALGARFGKQSKLLIQPRWQLMTLLQKRALAGDQVPIGQLTDLQTQIADGLKRAGAPIWLVDTIGLQSDYEKIRRTAGDPSEIASHMEAALRGQLAVTPFDLGRLLVMGALGSRKDEETPTQAFQLVLALNAQTPKSLSGRDRQAWLLTVARAQRSLGLVQDAKSTIASAGFEPDLCVASETDTSLLEQHFTYDDYPEELIAGDQEGSVFFEFGISSSGTVANPRIVYSQPAGLFDQPSAKGISSLRYLPVQRDGKPAPCRGIFQPVIWRLEDEEDSWVPSFAPQAEDSTT